MIPKFTVHLQAEAEEISVKIVGIPTDGPYEFAYYLYRGTVRIAQAWYSDSSSHHFEIGQTVDDSVSATAYVRNKETGEKRSIKSSLPSIDAPPIVQTNAVKKRHIRLKEWGLDRDRLVTPTSDQLEKSDNLGAGPYRLRTDSNGFIVSSRHQASDHRNSWVFLGDSFIESLYVAEDKRIVAQVEKLAQDIEPEVQCLNGGYSGATSLHLLNVLINKCIPIRPTLLVFTIPTNDGRAAATDGGYWNNGKYFSPFSPAFKDSSKLDLSIEATLPRMMETVETICSIWKIPLVFMTSPHRSGIENDAWLLARPNLKTLRQTIEYRACIAAITREHCSQRQLPLIDLELEVRDFHKISYDDLHLREDGAIVVAELITKKIFEIKKAINSTELAKANQAPSPPQFPYAQDVERSLTSSELSIRG